MKTLLGIVLLSVFVGGLYVVNDMTRTDDGKSLLNVAGELAINVKISSPEQRSIIRSVQAPGDVEACSEVDISAEVVAKILEMPVEEGDAVKKGDLLCRLDDSLFRARIVSGQANVTKLKATIRQADAELRKADRDYQRQVRLIEDDATSVTELADYKTALIRASTMVEVRKQELVEAEAMFQAAKDDLEKTVITAPIDGVVSQRFAKEGEVVVTGTMNNPGTRIMVISDLSKMQVRCRVDESDAALVNPDQVARIFLQSDTKNSIPGYVLRVATKGTRPQGRDVVTFETLVIVDADDPRVKPGMSANVEIEVARSEDALTIPVEAVVHRKRRDLPEELVKRFDEQGEGGLADRKRQAAEYLKVIFCIEDDKVHPRLVETGISDPIGVEIVRGLTREDRVVTGPFRSLDQLKDGSRIEILDDKDKKKEKEEPDKEGDEQATETGETHALAETD